MKIFFKKVLTNDLVCDIILNVAGDTNKEKS